ncbi:hypothetical protein [Sulfobacillus harzensis]|uniref:Uncharacterized protein n=1 Tax=Sulfobacillus harzensis TaxID=2729629 RepID=A0A7Y0L627_9FIRM|nr:hypothetical protein [Sulfobacillus harzensis]NMP23993.1 hypothetical protein [Sulfobacillus harzensis]
MFPEHNHRYRKAAADYTGLPPDDPIVIRLAAQAAVAADAAALTFLRERGPRPAPVEREGGGH